MEETCYRFSVYVCSEKVYMLQDGDTKEYDFDTVQVSERISYEPSEVIAEFLRMFCYGMTPEVVENHISTPWLLQAQDSEGDFINPSQGMIEAYEKGQMQLWYVSYEMYVERVTDLEEDELRAMLNTKEVA